MTTEKNVTMSKKHYLPNGYLPTAEEIEKHIALPYHLNYTKKALDKYLWLLGKKYFSKYDQV